MLEAYGIKLKRNKLYDAVYVANMCKADFLGKSVPNEEYLKPPKVSGGASSLRTTVLWGGCPSDGARRARRSVPRV